MNKLTHIIALLIIVNGAFAQNVGINTPSPTSALDVNGGLRLRTETSAVSGTTVVLPANRSNHIITGAPTGNFTITLTGTVQEGQHIIITNTHIVSGTLGGQVIPAGTTAELMYVNGGWKQIGSSEIATNTAWGLAGNTTTFSNFIGTLNDVPLLFKTGNTEAGGMGRWGNVALGGARNNNFFTQAGSGSFQNTAIGNAALKNNTAMVANTAIGFSASENNISGSSNTSVGHYALNKNKNGTYVVAIGKDALLNDTAAEQTVAIGGNALYWNNNRFGNTAVGTNALFYNSNPDLGVLTPTQALHNTALGHSALFNNRSGSGAVAIGYSAATSDRRADGIIAIGRAALYYNNNREGNVAIGDSALYNNGNTNVTGSSISRENVAVGSKALQWNIIGAANVAIGSQALQSNDMGSSNTAVGAYALYLAKGSSNTAVGRNTLLKNNFGENTAVGGSALAGNESGGGNVAIGIAALQGNISGSNNVAIGRLAGVDEQGSNKLYIENSAANKDNTLIYGDFAADSLLLNAKTINKFSLNVRGSNALEMGYGAAGKQTDAGKICYGCFGDPAHWLGIVGGGTNIAGNDRVIKLWSEGGLRIRGNALPDANNFYSLGTSGQRWKEVWTNAGAINTSDANLKTNIATSPYGLDEVMQMNPVQYNWKTNPSEDLQIGFLAQDIQKIIPEAVVVPANGDPLGMKYTELIPVLVKAIQELKEENEQYKKRIEKLEAIKK